MINKVNYLLKKSGLSITPLRTEVLAFLLENEVSSLDDIKKNIKEFDRVTLYRTVKVLIKFKIIKELSFENKKFLSLNRNIHKSSDSFEQSVYFYCMYCNNLTFLNNKIISFDITPDYEVHQSESIISGKCNLCN